MVKPEEFKRLILLGESETIELKESLPKLNKLSEEACAFANSMGGYIFLGIKDSNEICGITMTNSDKSKIQDSISKISPTLPVEYCCIEIEQKQVFAIHIKDCPEKPYSISGNFYKRNGANTEKVIRQEDIRKLFEKSNAISFEEKICHNFDFEKNFNDLYFKEFIYKANILPHIPLKQIITNLQLTSKEFYKNAFVLFFGKNPDHYIFSAKIRCLHFKGNNKVNIIDDKSFHGSLMEQYQQTLNWLKNKLDLKYEITSSIERKEFLAMPEVALRESLINALVHRDYENKGDCIKVELFEDKLVISNPGALNEAISKEEFGVKSYSRNPILFHLFNKINMIEQVGSGVPRMKAACLENNLPEPTFNLERIFSVSFHFNKKNAFSGKTFGKNFRERKKVLSMVELENKIKKQNLKLSEKEWKIIKMMLKQEKTTAPEMAQTLKVSDRTVENYIKKLREKKLLKREGPHKGRYWKVII